MERYCDYRNAEEFAFSLQSRCDFLTNRINLSGIGWLFHEAAQ